VLRRDSYTLASVTESRPDPIEIGGIAPADRSGGLHWTISRDHANDLARWWSTEDFRVKSGQRPIRDKECGKVPVLMFTPSMIPVRVRDRFGNIKVVGYSFPQAVLEHLGRWFSQQRLDFDAARTSEDT